MERPALKRLLEDVHANKVNVVVVYKVDRLTRSLSDFAKIVEALDAKGVSFVSVTQQFNTTTSMGRLTLNILLSFAQFEREVTGERIRDKIAASKKKGIWMGGQVPIGYYLESRKLIPHPTEAELVRNIFALYLKFGCVQKLLAELKRENVKTKNWVTKKGIRLGGVSFAPGHLYYFFAIVFTSAKSDTATSGIRVSTQRSWRANCGTRFRLDSTAIFTRNVNVPEISLQVC
jgi:site-specific DNA recombinase